VNEDGKMVLPMLCPERSPSAAANASITPKQNKKEKVSKNFREKN
jgi:hypothetical protein